jgi:hypothetical protein
MSNSVKYSVDGDTNAEDVSNRVKKSLSNLEKNVEGVQARFKNFGKDLFLSFAAPMVLFNQAINMISSSIEKARQETRDAIADAEKGENKYLRPGTVTSAREVARRKQDALDRKNAKLAATALAEEQMAEGGVAGFGGEGDKAIFQYLSESTGMVDYLVRNAKATAMFFGGTPDDPQFQDVLERRSGARTAADPALAAAAKQKEAAENQLNAQKALDSRSKTFSGADGFSNVVGVGANPVLTAISAQLEEQRKQTAILQQIAMTGSYTPPDFTKSDPHTSGYDGQM